MKRCRASRDHDRGWTRFAQTKPLHASVEARIPREPCSRQPRQLLRRAFQFNDREMPATSKVADVEFETNATSSSHIGLRCGARRTAGPLPTRLESRREAGRFEIVVDLVGCPSVQAVARTLPVDDGGPDPPRPASGQGNPGWWRGASHESLRKRNLREPVAGVA